MAEMIAITRSTPPITLLAMLVMLASNTAATSLPQASEQQSCAIPDVPNSINAHDTTGPVTFSFYCAPSQPPPLQQPSNARLDGRMIAIIVIATLLVRHLLRSASRWSSDRVSTFAHVQRDIPAGRSGAVSGAANRTASLKEQQARLFDRVITSGTAPPPAKPSSPTEATLPTHQVSPDVWTKSNPLDDVESSGEVPVAVGSYVPCACHRHSYERVGTTGSDKPTLGDDHPQTHHVPTDGSLVPAIIERAPQNDDNAPPLPESSNSHPIPSEDASLFKSFTPDPNFVYTISSLVFLAVGVDWADTQYHLPGVTFDLKWLKWVFSGSEGAVTLHTLCPDTLDSIRLKIFDIFNNAGLGTAIALYFNGHGRDNSLLLRDLSLVDAATLIEWITAIRAETGNHLPVCIVFDHCQLESSIQPSINLGKDIYILWACLPGQQSADFQMAGTGGDNIPRSNLLKAICLLVDEVRTRPTGLVGCFMTRINGCMGFVVRMMRAEECRMRRCLRPCPICSCPSYDRCSHEVTRSRHAVAEGYPRVQNPSGMFWGFEACVCVNELLHHIGPVANPYLGRIQETAERIKEHKIYRMLDESGRFTWLALWLILWSILVSVPRLILDSILPNRSEPAAGSVPNPAGLPGESNVYQEVNLLVQRGRDVNTAVVLNPPLPV